MNDSPNRRNAGEAIRPNKIDVFVIALGDSGMKIRENSRTSYDN